MDGQSDGAAERRRLDREKQEAVLGPMEFSRGKIEHARFVASQTGFKQGRGGDIFIELMVPYEFRDQAMGMLDAAGIPLSVDVVPWGRNATHEGRPHGG